MIDDRARDALRPRRGGPRPRRARGRDRGRGPRHGRGLGADPFRQQRDPPERRRDQRHHQPALRRRASGSGSPRPAGPTTRACAGSPRTPRRSPVSSRSSTTGAACPGRPRSATSPAAYSRATAEASAGIPRRGGSRGHRRGRRRRRDRLRVVRDRDRDRSPSPTRRASVRRGRGRHRSCITVSMGPDGGRGYAEAAAVDATTIDAARLGREAAGKARATADAVAIEPGDYPVVLEEYAVVDLLDMLGYLGFSALAVQEERSFFEPGKRIGTRSRDDRRRRLRPDGPAALVRLRGRRQAARRRSSSAGSAATSSTTRRPPLVPASRRPAMACRRRTHAGRSPSTWSWNRATTSREDLIGGLDRGLLVTRFHYTNPVHPKLAIVTGHDPRRHVPRRGRGDRRPGQEPALHAELPGGAGRDCGGRARAEDAQGLPRGRRRARRPHRRLDLHRATEH